MQLKLNNAGKDVSPFSRRFIQDLRAGKKFFAVLCVLNIMAFPVLTVCIHAFYRLCINAGMDSYDRLGAFYDGEAFMKNRDSITIIVYISLMFLIAAFLSGFVSALRSFSYLHKKTETDMVLSLPVSSSSGFAADYLSGLLLFIVPMAAAVTVSLICFFAQCSVNGYSFSDIAYFFYLYHADVFIIIKAALGLMLTAAMFYTLAVLVSVCCGKVVSSIVYTAILNAGVPLIIVSCSDAVYFDLHSVLLDIESSFIFSVSSPFGGLYYLKGSVMDSGSLLLMPFSKWLTGVSVVIVLMLVLSFIIYKKRKAEDTSKLVVFSGLFYFAVSAVAVISTAVSFTSKHVMFEYAAVVGLVISAVWAVVHIREKNKKVRSAVCSAVCFGAVLFFSFSFFSAAQKSGGFGAEKKVPKASAVREVEVYANHNLRGTYTLTLDDPESISAVCSLHKKLTECYGSAMPESGSGVALRLTYYTKGGYVIDRVYRFKECEEYRDLFDIYSYREKYSENAVRDIRDEYLYDVNNIWRHSILNESENPREGYDFFDIKYFLIIGEKRYVCPDVPELSDAVSEIAEKYRKEIMDSPEAFYCTDSDDADRIIRINGYRVPASFTETITEIEKNLDRFDKYHINTNVDIETETGS